MRYTYRHTLNASYLGYITQAIVNNLSPLLFVIFKTEFGLSIEQIGLLISINFAIQIVTDLVSTRFIDRVGFRVPAVVAHVLAAIGLVLLGVLPGLMPPYLGLLVATLFTAVGGGLTEVLISPIVEALPGDEKASAMSFLHSFYSWGQVSVVLVTTAFFALFGSGSWRILPIVWALVPAFNTYLFAKVPLCALVADGEREPIGRLFKTSAFWLLLILMVCSGAAEQAMAQWSSLFAEMGLGVSKSTGDLLGPCLFAVLMGVARTFYGVKGSKIRLKPALVACAALAITSYALAVLSGSPILSLVGCAMTGLAVGLLWPGVFSLSSKRFPAGGATMFAILALAGDLGCSIGPGLVGLVSSVASSGAIPLATKLFGAQDMLRTGLHMGLMSAMLFPILLLIGLLFLKTDPSRLSASK
ncbi:MAG: MFS transporter [Clostridia bacterium]